MRAPQERLRIEFRTTEPQSFGYKVSPPKDERTILSSTRPTYPVGPCPKDRTATRTHSGTNAVRVCRPALPSRVQPAVVLVPLRISLYDYWQCDSIFLLAHIGELNDLDFFFWSSAFRFCRFNAVPKAKDGHCTGSAPATTKARRVTRPASLFGP